MANKAEQSVTPVLAECMNAARRNAEELDREFIGTQHVLLAMIKSEGSTALKVLHELGVDVAALKAGAEDLEPPSAAPWGTTRRRSGVHPRKIEVAVTTKTQAACQEAIASAAEFGGTVGTGQVLIGLFDAKGPAGALMSHLGIKVEDARQVLRELYERDEDSFRADSWAEER
jgi:ATP-dependent Clp protease ATP-binding subunit ClpA